MRTPKLFWRFINLITFTDIPIWQKIFLFAGGGIFWFIITALVGLGAVTYVNSSSHILTDQVVPQIKASQKLIINIRGANVSVHNIVIHDDMETVSMNYERDKFLHGNITTTLTSLLEGGVIKDYSDLTGELIEEFEVAPLAENTSAKNHIGKVLNKSSRMRESLETLMSLKMKKLGGAGLTQLENDQFMNALREYDLLTVQSVVELGKLTSSISVLQSKYTDNIKKVLQASMVLFIIIGVMAITLVIVFSYFLKASITDPLNAITNQIKGLSEGEVDLTKQIAIGSKDEIAQLSTNFNMLMNTIHDMNTFKKVIEEDDTLDDVYNRMAEVFYDQLGLDDLVMFEISNRNVMKLIDTPYSKDEICCNKEILVDSNLCRARKTGHTVSSITYKKICKQYLLSPEKYHVCVPIIIGGATGGIVQFNFDKSVTPEHEKPTPIIQSDCIARQILKAEQYIRESTAVIETKKLTSALKESSVKDQMTGLYNRRFLEEYVDTLVARVMRKGSQVGLLMCDLDFFKEVNDKYGHDVGDTVLKATANVISKSARSGDLVIRFGGEEFVVIVNDAKPGDTEEVAERIRKKIAETKVKTSGVVISKTISIGISEFPKDTQNFWEAIKYADIALYKAKDAGRNTVLKFKKEMWTAEAY